MKRRLRFAQEPLHCALRSFRLIALISIIVQLSACNNSRFPEPFYLVSVPAVAVVDRVGVITVRSSCAGGQQLLGGGYLLIDAAEPTITGDIAVLENYPSSSDTWSLSVNVDAIDFINARGSVIMVVAYCLTTPNYPVNVVIATSQNQGAGGAFPVITASCPAGGVLTGGGYKTGRTDPSAGLFNAKVMMSAPAFDTSFHATGWQVGLAYVFGETPPTTTAYALCATRNLTANVTVIASLDLTKLAQAYGWADTQALCPDKTFTTGGGYILVGDPLIPHPVNFSNSRDQFSAWRFRTAYGYQTPGYPFRPCDPNLNANCAKTSAIAACVNVPSIPFVKVKITAPPDGTHLAVQSNGTQTVPTTFTALASDETGAPLTGNSVQWFRDGMYFGNGTSVTASWPTPFGAYVPYKIKVVAYGRSTSASDQITVTAGSIQ